MAAPAAKRAGKDAEKDMSSEMFCTTCCAATPCEVTFDDDMVIIMMECLRCGTVVEPGE